MKKELYFFLLLMFYFSVINSQNLSPNTTGNFTFIPESPLDDKPIEVYFHIPSGDITTMPILFSFHGASRNADDYRDFWIDMANDNNFIVIAPQFSDDYYPGLGDDYLMGNVYVDGDNPTPQTRNPENEWTFSVIDPLFDLIVNDINGTQTGYKAWGHSGGAQFLHRLLMFLPESRVEIAVCSNAGWYTVPEYGISFPYGIDNSEIYESDLINIFSNKLIVHLGENDNDPNSAGLRHNNVLDNQQGLNRFDRGNYFYNYSMSFAEEINVFFNWELYTVPNVGHNAQEMANDALEYLLAANLNVNNLNPSNLKFFPNPSSTHIYLNHSKNFKAVIFDLSGKEVINELITDKIDISCLEKGNYILVLKDEINTTTHIITKN
jgi:hypothetical protein